MMMVVETALWNYCQGEIIAIAAFVIGFESVAADRDRAAVGQIGKGASDRRCAAVAQCGKDGAGSQCTRPEIRRGKLCATVNGRHRRDYGIGLTVIAIDLEAIARVGVKGQAPLDRQRSNVLISAAAR